MNEHGFIKSVHAKIPSHVHAWKIHDPYTGGVPDCWYRGNEGRHLFIEYKYVRLPRRASTVVNVLKMLSDIQQEWLIDSHDAGVPVGVIVGSDCKKHLYFPGLEWQSRIVTRAAFLIGYTTPQIAKIIEETVWNPTPMVKTPTLLEQN